FFFILPPPPISTLFPYTTLFRSLDARLGPAPRDRVVHPGAAALGFARIEVHVELPEENTRAVADLEEAHPRVPNRRLRRLDGDRSEEHTSELQSLAYLVCRLLLE